MRLEHYPVEKLKKELLEIIGKRLDLSRYKVFFFGSRVANRGSDRADIDIGISGPEPVSASLWLEIQEEVTNFPILYKIDLVDFSDVTPNFKEVALQHTEALKS